MSVSLHGLNSVGIGMYDSLSAIKFSPCFLRYHFCFLCSARILCDRHFISKHLRGSHAGYSMAEYEKLVAHSGPSVQGAPRSALEEQGEAEKRVMAEVMPAPLPRLSKT